MMNVKDRLTGFDPAMKYYDQAFWRLANANFVQVTQMTAADNKAF